MGQFNPPFAHTAHSFAPHCSRAPPHLFARSIAHGITPELKENRFPSVMNLIHFHTTVLVDGISF